VIPDILDFENPTRGIIVGPDYDKAEKEFRYIAEALVTNKDKVQEALGCEIPEPLSYLHNAKVGRMEIIFPWGAEVYCKSAKQFASLLGDQWDWCILSETAELEEYVWTRGLSTRVKRAIFPTTPSMKAMWIKKMAEKATAEGDTSVQSWHYPPEANPFYDMDRFREELQRHGQEDPYFREQFLGEWTFYGGRVFPQFQPEPVEDITHHLQRKGIQGGMGAICIEPFDIPPHWMRFGAMDFGWDDPTCHLWFAVAPNGDVIVYDEYYERMKGSREHVALIDEKSVRNGSGRLQYVVVDKGARQVRMDMMMDLSFPTIPCNNDRLAGRLQVANYFSMSPDTQLPSVRIVKENCPNLVRELMTLHYDAETMNVEGRQDARYKGDDHAYDTLRYGLMSRPMPRRLEDETKSRWTYDVLKRHAKRIRRANSMIGRQRDAKGRLIGQPY
jgi:hypothetical protein